VPALQQLAGEVRGDQAFGVQVLIEALFAPIECIARNSGVDPAVIAHRAREACPNETFDATRNAWVEPWQAGIVDPLPVVVYALKASASAAVMAMTTDVLVRHRVPEVRTEP
jgi:chaperonin GroEL